MYEIFNSFLTIFLWLLGWSEMKIQNFLTLLVMESKIELEWWGGLIAPATSTTPNFTKKIEFFFAFTKIKTNTGACFPNSLFGIGLVNNYWNM